MPVLLKYLLLPVAMAATIGLTLAAYLALGRRGLRGLPLLRATLVTAVAVLLFFPSWTRQSREVYRPAVAVLLDTSASMQVVETAGGRARYTRALEALAAIRQRFQGEFDINLYAFDRKARRVTQAPPAPEGKETDLAAALAEVLNHEDKSLTRGLFVIGDGRSTAADSPAPWARTSAIPIYPVAIGNAEFPYRDLEIASVEAPDHMFKDSLGQVQVHVRAHGLEDGLVALEQGGRRIDQKPFSLKDGGQASFELRPSGSGLTLYTVRAVPRSSEPPEGASGSRGGAPGSKNDGAAREAGELTAANNSRTVPIFIESTPRKVLLLAATPGWEYTFLKRQLRSDPRYEVADPQGFEAGRPLEFPEGGLAGFGMVIVSGFRKTAFTPDQLAALRKHVQSGDGVLVFAGNGRDNIDELLASELAGLLPVAAPALSDESSSRFQFQPSEKSPLFRILEHPQANQQAWRSLPPILVAHPALQSPASATVLGTFPRYPRDTPAIAYRLFGRGMTVLFNTDETYLWKTLMDAVNDPDRLYERFWANLLSWLTDEARATGVSLTLSRLHYTLGDEVYVRVEDFAGKLEGVSRENLGLTWQSEGATGRLSPEKVSGGFLASFTPESEGMYRLELAVPGGDKLTKEFLVDAPLRDFTNPLADSATMQELADLSGGKLFAEGAGDIGTLRLDPTPEVKERTESLFWLDHGWALTLCLTLLAVEWLLRKKFNLV